MRTFKLTLLYWYQSLFSLSEGLHMINQWWWGGVSALERGAAMQKDHSQPTV